MAEPPEAKKAKIDKEGVFESFHSDISLMKKLKDARRSLLKEKDGFCMMKVIMCNGYKSVSFSEAFCDVERNVDDPMKRKTFSFASVFERGFDTIDAYISSPYDVPKTVGERIALERLLEFLMFNVKDCEKALGYNKKEEEKLSESEWAVKLAHHLLSTLAANRNYVLDNHKPPQSGKKKCPCCQESISGKFEDTSVGATSVWHGYLDIIFGKDSVPVPVHVELDNEPDSPLDNESSFEMELGGKFSSFYQQMISKTIVFSFLIKKLFPDYENHLIPTLGITNENVFIYMYDCENDILLESSPLSLLIQDGLSIGTVLSVWLAINYKYFCSGAPDSMKELNYKADFPKLVAPVFNIYKEGVKHQCGSAVELDKPFTPNLYNSMSFDNGHYKGRMDN